MSKSKNTNKEKGTSKRKWSFLFWGVYLLGILCIVLIFAFASWGILGKMPTFEELENPETSLATEVFSADGETIGKFYQENRTPVDFDNLPDDLVKSLIATEDSRYYTHSGIDIMGTMRAIVYLGRKGGASTISQQLAKQLFHEGGSPNVINRIIQKIKEYIIAVRLEKNYTKEEIIAMYYNIYDFGHNANGIRSASRIYFGKEPKDLNIEESAVLTGMLKNSSLYNPIRNPQGVTNRRNVVLHQMAQAEYITEEQKDSLQQLELQLDYTPESHQSGIATYFREYLRDFLKKWAKENEAPDGTPYDIYQDGLKVYTTIDARMQKHAEDAATEHIKKLQNLFDSQNENLETAPFRGISQEQIDQILENSMRYSHRWQLRKFQEMPENSIIKTFHKKRKMRVFAWNDKNSIDTVMTPMDSIRYYKSFLNVGMMSMTPQTGAIKAWVGGINYKHFKFDHVKKGRRQVGSTFKPFVYATAIDQLHYSPCKEFPNSKHTIPKGRYGLNKDWTPKNSNNKYGGLVTLKEALAKSLNVVTARLIDKTGPQPVIDLLGNLGIDTTGVPPAPAISLGSVDMSVYDMVSAYSTFANKGVYVKPKIVTSITDKNGTVLYHEKPETRDVMNEESAYVTTKLMQGVTEHGTGTRLRGSWAKDDPYYKQVMTGYPYDFKNPIAGKTGTSQNQSDGWFLGTVPNLTTGIWAGGENRSVHFSSIRYGQGATMALPIWGSYMKKLYADDSLSISKENFEEPQGLNIDVDCDSTDEKSDDADDPLENLRLN